MARFEFAEQGTHPKFSRGHLVKSQVLYLAELHALQYFLRYLFLFKFAVSFLFLVLYKISFLLVLNYLDIHILSPRFIVKFVLNSIRYLLINFCIQCSSICFQEIFAKLNSVCSILNICRNTP